MISNYTVRPPEERSKGKEKDLFTRLLISTVPYKGDDFSEIVRKVVFIGAVIAFAITGGILIKDVSGEIVQKYVVTPQLQEIKEQASS